MNIQTFAQRKQQQQKISMVTCYDHWSAQILNKTDIDCLLVGDSLAVGQSLLPSLVADSTQVRALDGLFAGRIEARHADPLGSSLKESISQWSESGNVLAQRSQVAPGTARNSIDRILSEASTWSVSADEYFSEEEDDESNENWLEELFALL